MAESDSARERDLQGIEGFDPTVVDGRRLPVARRRRRGPVRVSTVVLVAIWVAVLVLYLVLRPGG